MHHYILVKIKADSVKDAKDGVNEALESSINEENNRCRWEYYNGIERITKTLLKEWKLNTYKKLEEQYKSYIHKNLKQVREWIKKEFFLILAKKFLSPKEAPLYINSDNSKVKELVEKILKSDAESTSRLPQTYEELISGLVEGITDGIKDGLMFSYYIKRIDKMYKCLEYPDENYYMLQCTDNHFVDLKGKGKTYYFVCDRHY